MITTIQIIPGAGGEESIDFARMLAKSYRSWIHRVENATYSLERETLEELVVEMDVRGPNNQKRILQEHGFLRLCRISPFDAKKRRHTSFVEVVVGDLPRRALNDSMDVIRSYIFSPYALAKNRVNGKENADVQLVLDGNPQLLWDDTL